MSRSTPPKQPVIMPATITMTTGCAMASATLQPMIVNTTRPTASSVRKTLRR
jgi:hypothetical protein